jgi:hypothetical protein
LYERKRQQQEDDKVKKSLVRNKNTFVAAKKDNNNHTMPYQYATRSHQNMSQSKMQNMNNGQKIIMPMQRSA